jgi:glyoxylase-like metal-dependent hydrolase (beta-lactamase superfamily II)
MNGSLHWDVFVSTQPLGKNLVAIYATHGHGEHFFGVSTIRQRFPNAVNDQREEK